MKGVEEHFWAGEPAFVPIVIGTAKADISYRKTKQIPKFAAMIKKNIPNAITCGNLLCGCLAITSAFHGDLIWAAYLVGIAAVLDFLDGFVARVLKVHSEIGKQLDSLADMVTFGVVPGVMIFKLLNFSIMSKHAIAYFKGHSTPGYSIFDLTGVHPVAYLAFLIPIFSCIRLAKFNIDTRQSDSFIGVPTPANSLLIASFPLILGIGEYNLIDIYTSARLVTGGDYYLIELMNFFTSEDLPITYRILLNPYFLIGITILMSYLLIAELPLFALKFKHFRWKGNEIRFIFLGLSLLLLILFKFIAIPFIIFLYIILSVINNIGKKKKEEDYDLIANK